MRVIGCVARFHAPSSHHPLSVIRRIHQSPRSSSRCHGLHIDSSRDNKMEKHDLSTNTVIDNPQAVCEKIALIRDAGPSKFQVIADFDATLTRYWVNGRRGMTSHGLLQQGNSYYDAKRQELYEYYHPLEISPAIPVEEKTSLMEEWWGKTHGLLIEGGLTFDAIKKSVADSSIAFREGVVELFEFLEEKDIPVLIFQQISSAGLADVIEEVLRQKLHRTFKNVRIVSNRMVFDDNGCLVSFKGKLIHVLNKNEHALDMAAPLHDQLGDTKGADEDTARVKLRTNVLLLGDHLGDLSMSDGLKYENRISVGFLNDNIDKSLQIYRSAFDIVYLNDAPISGVVDLVSQLFPTEAS
ncbi:PREDICTED: LOW QUALITY PROTEIN: 7-methylguanosine phosphate-specific 5'-nucleotidase A [Tarenaya hassleriana]|uniref:LOW QUALITY PROTEIN: 7-methylguanosine phosphate-specific 5'-nucleotidase A n=1 Tax=Tarenaya hassleriana TaxID=28532 RepID=UPI00053C5B4C|nr:PREDICTED: LOW QUALITY PROTEIN: 7-methylguanosine phosphate-specific 5'-nucleotidase A [Tarenaya hassleriana]